MNKYINRYVIRLMSFIAVTAVIINLCSCTTTSSTNSDETYSSTDYAMGTVVNQTLYGNVKNDELDNVSKEIMTELTSLEEKYLSWRCKNSIIDKINSAAGTGNAIELDSKQNGYISKAVDLAIQSGGAFDPTIGKLTRLWDIGGENPHIPDDIDIKQELAVSGYKHLKYNTSGNASTLMIDDNASLDLGAIGKGIGCDEAMNLLSTKRPEITGAVIAVGGSILVYGSKSADTPWKIAISGPRLEISKDYLGILNMPANDTVYVSTSGDYEKYFVENGVRYHHILDPSTGYPSDSGLISVTVVCDNGLISDGLSTACFVLGFKNSLPLLAKYNAEAIFVDSSLKVTVTDGLKDSFELTSKGYMR